VIGADVFGPGKMADLDPEHRRVTDLVGMYLTISLRGALAATLSGQIRITQLRDYWNNAAGVTVTAWQSVLADPKWSTGIERSHVLGQLRDTRCDGLSVRLTPIAKFSPEYKGLLLGVVGPWSQDEPEQFVAARRLISMRPPGQLPFPVALFLVDEGRRKLVVDLGNLPLDPDMPPGDTFITGLVACILQTTQEGGGVCATLGHSQNITASQWLGTAGIIEWDLDEGERQLLDSHRLRLTFSLQDGALVMEEHPSGCYIDVDRRSLRINPGDSKTVYVYARYLGHPLPGQVVNFHLHQQTAIAPVETILAKPDLPRTSRMFGYPTDPNSLMNSEPREALFDRPGPLVAVTGQDGRGELTITARNCELKLPVSRQTIDSQLYFLGEPNGWQSWGAIGPNNGDLDSSRIGAGCALAVLVFNTHDEIKDPKWSDVEAWLARYSLLYPVMTGPTNVNLDLAQEDILKTYASQIYERLQCEDFENVKYMPVSRDLSDFRRTTILAYLRSFIPGDLPC
jgi:hypothetical protein